VIQAGGQLELMLLVDPTPYPSKVEGMARHGGILPPGTELLKERPESHTRQNPNDTSENWYLVQRPPRR